MEHLRERCGTKVEGWVFPSKCSAVGHLCSIDRLFREAREQPGLQKELVLYCARHDYGKRVLMRAGNLSDHEDRGAHEKQEYPFVQVPHPSC